MKFKINKILGFALISGALLSGCSKDFFNRVPSTSVTTASYYQTDAQLMAATAPLYGTPWFGFNNKCGWAMTEITGGNMRTWSSDISMFGSLPVSNANTEERTLWNSPFTVVAQCNALINNIATANTSGVSEAALNNALGEAHLMRAVAYFYLVRTFGNLPLIENTSDFLNNSDSVPTRSIPDVYKFIVRDLKYAEANCSVGVAATGHGSSGSASAMLSKVYLYMQNYDSARIEAEKVINSGEFALMDNFGDLFRGNNNNNKESILAMQWISNGGYDYGNSIQASWAYSSAITQTGDGYGSAAPTIDLVRAFEKEGGDTVRRHYTIMLPGEYYSELNSSAGGYTLPTNASSQGTQAQAKKYVIGGPNDPDNSSYGTAAQAGGNNTYIMRYADVLLIAAEAILGQEAKPASGKGIDTSASTSDATALKYYNMVRKRAGAGQVKSFTYRELLNERRLEFALEMDYWFDLGRVDGFKATTTTNGIQTAAHPVGRALIAQQERGTYANGYPDQSVIYSSKLTVSDNEFYFQVPANEVASDPNLTASPVPYDFTW
ncbi:Starch-binding associating with outer membrane [Arachidicoccus rhizosphaerae]|uniref:Starch-binding associating with outer membrane n=1 Tax=Arachidicoccus rhizosphaerae TaxID=551991 RepID=A0A1H3WIQ3_9BACT|nr:RagB/SusD family nutrient uptake outer membrane protein [Arachidicoccus rhizosphaerae]SDZ87005.1 Starch-binding associating with outer membrane [Arachidicoccus rhizosphaerae]